MLGFARRRATNTAFQQYRNFASQRTQGQLFDKILIANRGEITCRIIRTCRKMGIKTVAVFSDADEHSLFAEMADEKVHIGPSPTSQSYLNVDAIMKAVELTGAQAVHPGYGFLSENYHFCERLEQAGVKFIGPTSKAIVAMGDKIHAKTLATKAGVRCVPGFIGEIQNDEHMVQVAREIGYPVMIKASAGGGGKGLRVANNDAEAIRGFQFCRQEAKNFFADDRVFVEKFVEVPRHIEFQVLCDSFGNGVYLNERECSIQRRHQKVVEEAPSVFLTPEVRKKMGEQAVLMAKAVNYESAGTVEFLVDKNRDFYFMEMNTRLQVEHPVTEAITGYDLVEHMLRVASGQPLSIKQSDVGIDGWAVELRVYAEDPSNNFLPSIGKLVKCREPKGNFIRVDTGVREGDDISIYYDPMISKVIAWAPDRNTAIERMRHALDSYVIRGVTHNIPFLRSILDNPRFLEGSLSTAFIPEEYPEGVGAALGKYDPKDEPLLMSAAMIVHAANLNASLSINGQLEGFNRKQSRLNKMKELIVKDSNGDEERVHVKDIIDNVDGSLTMKWTNEAGKDFEITSKYARGGDLFTAELTDSEGNKVNEVIQVIKSTSEPKITLQYRGSAHQFQLSTPRQQELLLHMPVIEKRDESKMILSSMPGAVVSVTVKAGDSVFPGQEVAVIEAMKMQNALVSQVSGKVKSVNVKPGATVESGELLIQLE